MEYWMEYIKFCIYCDITIMKSCNNWLMKFAVMCLLNELSNKPVECSGFQLH